MLPVYVNNEVYVCLRIYICIMHHMEVNSCPATIFVSNFCCNWLIINQVTNCCRPNLNYRPKLGDKWLHRNAQQDSSTGQKFEKHYMQCLPCCSMAFTYTLVSNSTRCVSTFSTKLTENRNIFIIILKLPYTIACCPVHMSICDIITHSESFGGRIEISPPEEGNHTYIHNNNKWYG